MSRRRVLIVEDDEDVRTQMKWALASDYEIVTAGDQSAALSAFSGHRPTVTLLDLGLPPRPNDPEAGLATLASLLALDPLGKVIIVSGQGDRKNAIRAVGAGAYDFLVKPVDMDELRLVLQRCVYVAELEQEFRAKRLVRGHDWCQPGDARGVYFDSQSRLDLGPGVDPRREWYRQGNGGAGCPSQELTEEWPLCRHQLQRHP
jgi:DNA-binding NtrC family response regulator